MLRTRFAPTPSGFLHLGNAFSFVLTWLIARKNEGHIHLRIDDIDAERAKEAYVADIFSTIEWLGLDYDSGPQGVDDFYKNHSQQLRLSEYESALLALKQKEKLFACQCSRAQINGPYTGTCLNKQLDFDAPQTAWRIKTLAEENIIINDEIKGPINVDLHQEMPYFVVRTKQQRAAYQLVSVIEDIRLGINYIVRGEDLLASTAAQLFLARQLPQFAAFSEINFLHHGLWLDEQGQKLSKSAGASSIQQWRNEGRPLASVFKLFSTYLKAPEVGSAAELLAYFKN